MKALTLGHVAQLIEGQTQLDASRVLDQVSTDSRHVSPRTLFFALKGERFDAHDFVPAVLAAGAVAIVSEADGRFGPEQALVVKDPFLALQQLASALRTLHPGKVVALTGSVGKTTVKEMIAAALMDFGTVGKTLGNFNNHIGLPLTLGATTGTEDFLVLELGMSAPGEIARLTHLARPDVGLVTNAAPAHLAFFPSVDAIADAKAELFSNLSPHALAIANGEDARIRTRAENLVPQHLRYGQSKDDLVQLLSTTQTLEGVEVVLLHQGERLHVTLATLGLHQGLNVAAALTVAAALELDLKRAAASLSMHFQPAPHRMQLKRIGPMVVLDDCYNANPLSMAAALHSFALLPGEGKRAALLGSMRELGPEADALHRAVTAEAKNLSLVFCVGAHAHALAEGARSAGISQVYAADSLDALFPLILEHAPSLTHLLLKGSRGERLERLLPALETYFTQESAPPSELA